MRIIKTEKGKRVATGLAYVALLGILGASIYTSLNPDRPEDTSKKEWEEFAKDYNGYHDIDYCTAKACDDEYDISKVLASGNLADSLISKHDDDQPYVAINEYNIENYINNEALELSIGLVNEALAINQNLSRDEKDTIYNWVYAVKTIDPNFDFRIFAQNLKDLRIEYNTNKYDDIEKTSLYNPQANRIMITKGTGNKTRVLNHMLCYVATTYNYGEANFEYELDQYGYNNTKVNYGRGVSEMYAETLSTQINYCYSNNGNAKLLNDMGFVLRCIYTEPAFYSAYSAHDVRAFNTLIETYLSHEEAVKLTAMIDACYMDNSTNVNISRDNYSILAKNFINLALKAHQKAMTEGLKECGYDHSDEQLDIMNNQLYNGLSEITKDLNVQDEYDDYIASQLGIIKENVLKNKKSLN